MTTPALVIDHAVKTYANGFTALNDVSFTVAAGEFFGLLGPNGAGKTTLISAMAGLSRLSSGQIAVNGHDVRRDAYAARMSLGVVPQELVFDPFFSVREALRFQSGYFGIKNNDAWIDEIITRLGLADKADTNTRELSGGMKRRVMVAQALVHRPPVIVLDEPTAGVDVELRQTLWQFVAQLNKQGHTVLLTTHYLEEAEALCSRVAMLKRGKIVTLSRMDDLLKSASSTVLQFKTDDALPETIAARARVTGRIVQIPAHDAADVEQLLATLRQGGVHPQEVEIRRADLEDVFLHVMQQQQQQQAPGVRP